MNRGNILDKPELQELFFELLRCIPGESGRGALLVATAHVDDQLTKLIQAILPKNGNKEFRKILKYPGPLGSFSAKINLCFAFRLIGKRTYDSLHALRKLRNDAAHSSSNMELHELNAELKKIYDLGPDMPYHINRMATTAMLNGKLEHIKSGLEPFKLQVSEEKKIVENVIKENLDILEKQVPYWELVYGLTLICATISHHKDDIIELTKDMSVWSDLLKNNSSSEGR